MNSWGDRQKQKMANFDVIFDFFIVCFILFSNTNINYIMQLLWLFLKFEANVHIGFVTAQSSEHLLILATTPIWSNDYS